MTNYEKLENEVIEYFNSYNVQTTDMFCLAGFAEVVSLTVDQATTALCNLEDPNAMQFIADGCYDEFNINDGSLFNDNYLDMMTRLGFIEEDEDEDY